MDSRTLSTRTQESPWQLGAPRRHRNANALRVAARGPSEPTARGRTPGRYHRHSQSRCRRGHHSEQSAQRPAPWPTRDSGPSAATSSRTSRATPAAARPLVPTGRKTNRHHTCAASGLARGRTGRTGYQAPAQCPRRPPSSLASRPHPPLPQRCLPSQLLRPHDARRPRRRHPSRVGLRLRRSCCHRHSRQLRRRSGHRRCHRPPRPPRSSTSTPSEARARQ